MSTHGSSIPPTLHEEIVAAYAAEIAALRAKVERLTRERDEAHRVANFAENLKDYAEARAKRAERERDEALARVAFQTGIVNVVARDDLAAARSECSRLRDGLRGLIEWAVTARALVCRVTGERPNEGEPAPVAAARALLAEEGGGK
jgi:hypothetical protein